MESAENGIAYENDKNVVANNVGVEELDEDVKKDENIVISKTENCSENVEDESVKLDNEKLHVRGPEGDVSGTVKTKQSDVAKALSGGKKNDKVSREKGNVRGPTTFGRSLRSSMTKSLSFPAKGVSSDAMRKSVDVIPVKSDVKQSRKTVGVTGSKVLNKTVPSVSRLSTGMIEGKNSVSTKNESTHKGRRNKVAVVSSFDRSKSGKALAVKETIDNVKIEVLNAEIALDALEDDVHSTNSSNTASRGQRSTTPKFSFRLEERAEKRREFYSKIEEKIHAREMERNNLQEKSKESQEEEIKQLRKSLKFKATPMPTFYKEPPPKVELKKIPTTRAKSPKLGRNKSSIAASLHSSESGGSCLSPRASIDQGKSPKALVTKSDNTAASPMKAVRSSQAKSQSRNSLGSKTEVKPTKTKAKVVEAKNQDSNDSTGNTMTVSADHISSNPANPHEERVEVKSTDYQAGEKEASPYTPEKVPPEITVIS